MKAILLKDIKRLGKEGDVVEVKGGYLRNYLAPCNFALPMTKENLKKIEEIKRRKIKLQDEERKEAVKIKEKLKAISLTITCEVKDGDEIYGSVGEAQILKSLEEEGVEFKKGSIIIPSPIKKLGVYDLKVKLHPEVEGNIRVWVVKK